MSRNYYDLSRTTFQAVEKTYFKTKDEDRDRWLS